LVNYMGRIILMMIEMEMEMEMGLMELAVGV
jgi:hypothetical protein